MTVSQYKSPPVSFRKHPSSVRQSLWLGPVLFCCLAFSECVDAQIDSGELDAAIAAVRQVDVNGQGHPQAIAALQILSQASVEQVPGLLQGMDGANSLAVNWLRGAIQSVLDNQAEWPRAAIRSFLDDRSRCSKGRLMAYELLVQDDPQLADQLLPGMIDDPGLELRHKSIAWSIENAEQAGEPKDIFQLGSALANARDVTQIEKIADLMRAHGVNIDLQKQLGVINEWHIVGAFDNREEKGFDQPHGPEMDLDKIDLQASYTDTLDQIPVTWEKHNTIHPTGMVNVNDLLGKLKGATAYAYAEFDAAEEADCELRIGCINANKVWLNGKEIINNEIYHVGMMPDQFTGAGRLAEGTNRIMFKISQNEQEQPWAQDWMFQLRVCAPDGAAIPPKEDQPASE